MPEENTFLKEAEALRDLRALEAIERNPKVSQRELAQGMGVALGIVNACIRTLVRKGLIKIRGDNNRSISYHLTKKGLLHKSALAMQWTRNTIGFYQEARQRVALALGQLAQEGARRVVLYGAGELAEIVVIASRDAGVDVVGVLGSDDTYLRDELLDVPVRGFEMLDELEFDAIALCAAPAAGDAPRLRAALVRGKDAPRRVYSFVDADISLVEQEI